MKKVSTLIMLACILLLGESFKAKHKPEKAFAGYFINIDGAAFDAKDADNYSAQLINGSKTASITFVGNEVRDKQGRTYPTKIQVDYTFKEGMLGEVNVENVSYEYNNQKYDAVPGSAFMSVTKMKWSADKKSFALSADLFCKVQRKYVMEEALPAFAIRGQLQNLQVNIPAL